MFAGHLGEFDYTEVFPSAPPLELMDHVLGYDNISFDAGLFIFAALLSDYITFISSLYVIPKYNRSFESINQFNK